MCLDRTRPPAAQHKRLQLTPNSSFQSIRGTVLAAGAVPQRWRSALLGAAEPRDWPREWKELFDQSAFAELEEVRIPNRQTVDKETLVAFFGSMGWIAVLPDERRLPLLDEVRSLLAASEYALPWETRIYWARLGT
jgi:hypothetical protein